MDALFSEANDCQPRMLVDNEQFGPWLSGFTAGEGSFNLFVDRTGKSPICRANFIIALRYDDLPILEEIRKFLGCGHLTTAKQHKSIHPKSVYCVSKAADLADIIVPQFERNPLRAKKANDFNIWKEGVAVVRRISQRSKAGCCRGSGTGKGSGRKWKDAEVEGFAKIKRRLELQRAPNTDDVPPLPKPRKRKVQVTVTLFE